MKNDLFNTEMDELIRASMKLADEPDPAGAAAPLNQTRS